MFCRRCQTFWKEAVPASQVPISLTSSKDIGWQRYETVLHHTIRDLKHSSDLGCAICRAILFAPTDYERDSLLADEEEALDIVLLLDPNNGPHPVLCATFYEAGGTDRFTRIPKRMIASCADIITDGTCSFLVSLPIVNTVFRGPCIDPRSLRTARQQQHRIRRRIRTCFFLAKALHV
jgi:hypothetical protein